MVKKIMLESIYCLITFLMHQRPDQFEGLFIMPYASTKTGLYGNWPKIVWRTFLHFEMHPKSSTTYVAVYSTVHGFVLEASLI